MKNILPYFVYASLLFILGMQIALGQAKQETIYGKVFQENGKPLVNASVEVVQQPIQVKTDTSGAFSLKLLPEIEYSLQVSYLGQKLALKRVFLPAGQSIQINFTLKLGINQLSEIYVIGESGNQKARKELIKAEIIDTKAAQSKAVTLVELMNRSAGVRVRQSGALGSNTNIMLNGFQGKSIKIFKDGIPTDYLGASFSLSAIPVNMLDRVEVYKGVLPTEIGADALGGAINMVSRTESSSFLALSYEIGSFNTHRLSLNLKGQSAESGLYWGLDGFYNYSDNNYKVTANILDPEKSTISPDIVRLFHNQFKQAYVEVYTGLKNISWADELRIGLTAFQINRDNQFAALMEKPFGASTASEKAPIIPTLRYKKELFDGRLSLDQFLVFSKIMGKQTDTLSGSYNWYGQFQPAIDDTKRGEAGNPSLAAHHYTNFSTRTGVSYRVSPHNAITLNAVYNDYSRTGTDPYGPTTAGSNPIDLQRLPARYKKLVSGLGWRSNFSANKLENLLQVKYYHAQTQGQEVNPNSGYLKESSSRASSSKFGLAESIKYNYTDHTFLRLSGELTTRLPEQSEILGNGAYVLANFAIRPESSRNANLGFYTRPHPKIELEFNGFYRLTKDMIITAPINLLYSQSVNVESVKGIGVEADIRIKPSTWLSLNANGTYQDFRLFNLSNPLMDYLEGARLRNTPYFFGNLGASFAFAELFRARDMLQAYYNMSYVHEYYLNYIPKNTEPNGLLGLWGKAKVDAPNIIPAQTIHAIGFLYQPLAELPLTVNLECKNLCDAAVYDNFKIQNAGRSFHLKLNYMLKY